MHTIEHATAHGTALHNFARRRGLRIRPMVEGDLAAGVLISMTRADVEAFRDSPDAAEAYHRAECEKHGVKAGSCTCETKAARPYRVAGWLVCVRPECSRLIGA